MEKTIQKDLSAAEAVVVKVVWDAKEDIQMGNLIETIRTQYGKDYARTTVVTFVQRLAEKGYVSTYRRGRVSFVHAEITEQAYLAYYLNHLADFWYHGDCTRMVCDMIELKLITKEDTLKVLNQLA